MKHKFIAKRFWNDQPTAMSGNKVSGDIVDLTYGDPDYTTSELITAPTFEDIKNGHTHYTEMYGYAELREEIQKRLLEDYGLVSEPDEIYVTNGASHGMIIALMAVLDPGDEVLIQSPCYTPYADQIRMSGGVPVLVDTREEDGFETNAVDLEAHITNRTRAIIINNPCNPTGALFSRKALEDIGDIAKKYDLLVIADEVYAVMDYVDGFIPMASLPQMKERTITLCSASKEFAMTGWRVGFNFGPAYLINMMKRVNENASIMASSVAQRAYLHGLENRKVLDMQTKEIFRERVEYAYERISNIKNLSVGKPRATFYLFVNIRETGLSSEEFVNRVLEEASVALFQGNAFGDAGEGYVRIACTRTIEEMEKGFDRMEKMAIFQ